MWHTSLDPSYGLPFAETQRAPAQAGVLFVNLGK